MKNSILIFLTLFLLSYNVKSQDPWQTLTIDNFGYSSWPVPAGFGVTSDSIYAVVGEQYGMLYVQSSATGDSASWNQSFYGSSGYGMITTVFSHPPANLIYISGSASFTSDPTKVYQLENSNPIPVSPDFGPNTYIESMMVFKGPSDSIEYLYAGVSIDSWVGGNATLWRMPLGDQSGANWTQLVNLGTLDSGYYRIQDMEVLNNELYLVINDSLELIKSPDGISFNVVNNFSGTLTGTEDGFSQVEMHNGTLFASVIGLQNGGKLISTNDGTNWMPVNMNGYAAGNGMSEFVTMSRGFNDLWVSTLGDSYPVEIIRSGNGVDFTTSNVPGFNMGSGMMGSDGFMQSFGNYMYFGTRDPFGGTALRTCIKPQAEFGSNNGYTICQGESLTFSDSTIYADSIAWYVNGTYKGSASVLTYTFNTSGTFAVELLAITGQCSDTITKTVNVFALPGVVTNGDQLVCLGSPVQLFAAGADTYTWSPSSSLSSALISSPTATPAVTTTYTVTGVDVNGCVNNSSLVVTVSNLPSVFATGDATICEGDSTSIVATGASVITWSPSTGLTSPSTFSTMASPLVSTTYVATGMDGNGCSNSDTVTVSVVGPSFSNAGNDTSICDGSYVFLNGTISGNVDNLFWTSTGTGSFGSDSLLSTYYMPSVADVSSGSVGLILNSNIPNLTCATASDTVIAFLNSNPLVLAGPDQNICSGNSVALSATASGNGSLTYNWSPSADLDDANLQNPTATPSVTTTYTVSVMDSLGCNGADVLTVTVFSPGFSASGDTSICFGNSTTLTASGSGSYSWSPSAGLSDPNVQNPVATPNSSTTYTVIHTDLNGCSLQDSVDVTVLASVVLSISSNQNICDGDSVLLFATGALNYSWSPTSGLSNSNGSSTYASSNVTTSYVVLGSDINGCQASDSVTVTVNPVPVANAGVDQTICQTDTAFLNASGGDFYQWIPSGTLNNANIENPEAYPTTTTTYTVTALDASGCSSTDDVIINVDSLPSIGGTVTFQGSPVTVGMVKLFKINNGNGAMATPNSSSLSGNGDYLFTGIAEGDYLVKAMPNPATYPFSINTFHPSAHRWDSAVVVTAVCSQNHDADIVCLEMNPFNGQGNINGLVLEGDDVNKTQVPGDPIPGVDVHLEQVPGGLAASTTTDPNGYYGFMGVPEGTWRLFVDIPGLDMDSTYTVVIDTKDTLYTQLNFLVDSSDYIYIGEIISVPSIVSTSLHDFSVYPNPFNDVLNLEGKTGMDSPVSVRLYSTMGKLISKEMFYTSNGKFSGRIYLDESLASGVYFLNLSSGEWSESIRIIRF